MNYCKGFSQGCPISPIFGALVLGVILKKVYKDLDKRVQDRLNEGETLDDDNGGVSITMAYIDDVNALVPLEDVKFFLDKFKMYGEELGGFMNTEKTKIMTSTSNSSLVTRLQDSSDIVKNLLADDLESAIATYSRKKREDKTIVPHEVTDGLRVLGAPIGNTAFCQ